MLSLLFAAKLVKHRWFCRPPGAFFKSRYLKCQQISAISIACRGDQNRGRNAIARDPPYVSFYIQILGTITEFSFNKPLALKKTNFVSRNIGHSNKFALLPLCQHCIQFWLLRIALVQGVHTETQFWKGRGGGEGGGGEKRGGKCIAKPWQQLNKLASLQCMGLHSSAGWALQRERRGHGARIPLKPRKTFFFPGYFAIA